MKLKLITGFFTRLLVTTTAVLLVVTAYALPEVQFESAYAQFIQAIGKEPMEFQPGDSWKYCNTGFNLLGYIIENVSGSDYWDFMGERVFGPLGMKTTTQRRPSLVIPNRVFCARGQGKRALWLTGREHQTLVRIGLGHEAAASGYRTP